MKTLLKVLSIVVLGALISCGKSGTDTTASDPVDEDANQALYDQVMDIHDEVMPKMDDLYKLKKQLQDSIAKTPAMVEDTKKELEQTIQQLDSASNSMMVWMRQFNPPTDSASQEALREYLEAQLEMVRKMRENVLEALDKGKKQN
jgi:Mg2+ and Co2+ transporter CorA